MQPSTASQTLQSWWKRLKNPFLHTDSIPSKTTGVVLAIIPFLVLGGLYLHKAEQRHAASIAENSGIDKEKIMPYPGQILEGVKTIALKEDMRLKEPILKVDTIASGKRLLWAYAYGVGIAVLLGLHMGAFPFCGATFGPVIRVLGFVPPILISPVLVIAFGIDELPKIMAVIIGFFFSVTLATYNAASEVPMKLIQGKQSLGLSQFEILYRVILPGIAPKVVTAIRESLQMGVACLMAAEFLAASAGIGYRVYLLKRNMLMEQIIPYVLWVALLCFIVDRLLGLWISWRYPWFNKK
jgi:NitT/TauT family transport system permease protein